MSARFAALSRLAAALLMVLAGGVSTPARATDFVGSESCRVCHQAAFDQWKESPHARALGSLSPDQQKDGRCLQCHARDVALGGDTGVTCETCHGAGQYYWPAYVMKDGELARATGLVLPDAKSCGLCHDASSPALDPFDPATKLKAIDHWTASRAARAAQKKADATCPRREAPEFKARATFPGPDGFLARALKSPPGKPSARPAVQLAEAAVRKP